MTREQAIRLLLTERVQPGTGYRMAEVYTMAIKALEQEPILDKIYADIQRLRGCSCSCSDGIIDDVEDIIDKYKGESEG